VSKAYKKKEICGGRGCGEGVGKKKRITHKYRGVNKRGGR